MSRENLTHKGSFITKTLSAIVITCALAAFQTAPAVAQSASKLDCKDCVKSKHIEDGKIKGKDLKDKTVSNDKIEDGAVDGSKIEDGAVGNDDLSSDAVTGDKIADGAVDSADVQDNSLTSADIRFGTLTGSDVQNNSLNSADVAGLDSADISDEAGAEYAFESGKIITSTGSTVISDTLTAPTDGIVTIIVNGSFSYIDKDTDARCSIQNINTTAIESTNNITASISAVPEWIPFTALRTFTQSAGTSVTYRLNCNVTLAVGTVTIDDMNMVIMFFPTQY